jgi:hypothetical protein
MYATLCRNAKESNIFYNGSVIISQNIDDQSVFNSPAVYVQMG